MRRCPVVHPVPVTQLRAVYTTTQLRQILQQLLSKVCTIETKCISYHFIETSSDSINFHSHPLSMHGRSYAPLQRKEK